MPIYEYRCADCQRKSSIWWPSLSKVDERKARCERCGSARLTRVMSKVRMLKHGLGDSGPKQDAGGDQGDEALLREMESLDESDPRALGSFMRKMAKQTGEDMGEEFDEVVGRLEAGEDPDAIEAKMGDVLAAPDGMDDDPYGAPPAPPEPKEEKPTKPEPKRHRASVAKGKAATKPRKRKTK
jgi:putative FmdB family regulatory protein